jgi:flagellin
MRINTNVSALTAQRNLQNTAAAVQKSMAKLSSGFRINSASDDAAGLAIANKFRADIRSLTQASRNAEQANSVLQIAEGGAANVEKILERMKELATQSAADAVDTDGRTQINNEFNQLSSEIDRITSTVKFQGDTLLNGSYGSTVSFSSATTTGIYNVRLTGGAAGNYTLAHGTGVATLTGAGGSQTLAAAAATAGTLNFSTFGVSIDVHNNIGAASLNGQVVTVGAGSGGKFMVSSSGSATNDAITLDSLDLRISTMGLTASTTVGLDTRAKAETTLTAIDTAIKYTATALGKIGSAQNRIEFANSNTKTALLNVSAAESVLRDLDMAEEMTKFSKSQILQQAGTAMLAQANQSGQAILQLLQG